MDIAITSRKYGMPGKKDWPPSLRIDIREEVIAITSLKNLVF